MHGKRWQWGGVRVLSVLRVLCVCVCVCVVCVWFVLVGGSRTGRVQRGRRQPCILADYRDLADDRLRAEFVFTNPNSKGECGCGESFNV